MHELSIASAILERAQKVSESNGNARILKVGLRIGEVSGVEPEALAFGFEVLCKDTPMAGAALEIERCKRRQRCDACAAEFEPREGVPICPVCASAKSTCITGRELDVAFFELEDPPCV